jgi:hypothetical protein
MSDFDQFRLRRFMEALVHARECRVIDEPLELIDVARHLDGEEKAVWFKAVGPNCRRACAEQPACPFPHRK